MLTRCKQWSSLSAVIYLFFYSIPKVSSMLCYECQSTFPGSDICLPPCSQSEQANSTCILTRDIPLAASGSGSLRASHIIDQPVLLNAVEKNFLFGEEAVYQTSSGINNWDWQYGQITYGCDTSGCNDPQNVNRLPDALNALIPDTTLNELLLGDVENTCYQCNTCFDENNPVVNMSACGTTACPDGSCNFVATRYSSSSTAQCGDTWHFTSGCIPSREPSQVDMTLMYYINSGTTKVYQMEAICHTDNCNNFNTFTQLKNALSIDPDLSCLVSSTIASSTHSSSTSTNPTTATTSRNFADHISMNNTPWIFMIFFNIYQIINS